MTDNLVFVVTTRDDGVLFASTILESAALHLHAVNGYAVVEVWKNDKHFGNFNAMERERYNNKTLDDITENLRKFVAKQYDGVYWD